MDPFAPLDQAIENASPSERAALVIRLSARLATLGASLAAPVNGASAAAAPDRNLDVPELAERMNMSVPWVYRHGAGLPFAVRVGRRLLFSERGLERYLERQTRRR